MCTGLTRGHGSNLSDFLYTSSTDENQCILLYFQLYELEQCSWMVLKLFLFSENYFLVKIFGFLDTPIRVFLFAFFLNGKCQVILKNRNFSSKQNMFGTVWFFDPILQREGKKKTALPLYHTYHKNLTSVASYRKCRSF